jgi:hypothetical protein
MTSKIIELDRERILKRIGYYKEDWRAFIVDGFGFVGAIEIITPGQGAFGQSGRAVVIIRNFIRYIECGGTGYYVPPEYFIAKIRTKVDDERLPQKILKRLEAIK